MCSVWIGAVTGGALLSRCVSCWICLPSVQRSRARQEEKPQTRKPGRTSCTGWHFSRGLCAQRTVQCFDLIFFSFFLWFNTSGRRKNCSPHLCSFFSVLLSFVTVEQVVIFFVCNITGFMVGAFPFINVHWCSRKRGGDKVGESAQRWTVTGRFLMFTGTVWALCRVACECV